LIAPLAPIFGSVEYDASGYDTSRHQSENVRKFESYGTHPSPLVSSLVPLIDFHEAIGAERLRARLHYLARYWADRAASLPPMRMATSPDPALSCSLVAWEMEGIDSGALTRLLRQRDKIMLGGTEPYRGFFGIPENNGRWIIVANTAMFTTLAELDRFVDALERIARDGIG
jgi:selenocysteine lyase/cysteine desulfurase